MRHNEKVPVNMIVNTWTSMIGMDQKIAKVHGKVHANRMETCHPLTLGSAGLSLAWSTSTTLPSSVPHLESEKWFTVAEKDFTLLFGRNTMNVCV